MIDNSVEFENGISLPPGTVVGYRRNGAPIYNIAGGAELSVADDTDGDDDDDASDVDDSDDGDEDDWTPPTKEEWQKIQEAKRKADSEAAQRKRFLRDAGFDPKTGRPIEKPTVQVDDEDEDDTDVVVPKKKADEPKGPAFDREKFEKQFQRQLDREVQKAASTGRATAYSLIHEVPAALTDAGWNGKNLPRMIKLLDLDSVEIDEDGVDYDALAAQVTELKKDFPEFFKRTRMKEAAREVADTGAAGGGRKKAPASEEDVDWKTRMKMQLLQGN